MDVNDTVTTDIHTKILKTTLEVSSRRGRGRGDADSTEICCVICLDTVSERCEARPCNHHNFDFICLASWLQERAACPLCQGEIKEVRYDYSDDDNIFKIFHVPSTKGQEKPPYSRPATTGANFQRPRSSRHERWREPRPPSGVTPERPLERRRHVYRDQLYSRHVGSNRYSRYQELSPGRFESDTQLVSRARLWIRRELQVFGFLAASQTGDDAATRRRANNAEFLLEYIIAILKSIDIQGSCGQAEELLQDFLGREDTKLFLHELRSWLRSPYTSLEAWDRNVQYDESKPPTLSTGESSSPTPRASCPRRASSWRPNKTRYAPYQDTEGRRAKRQQEASPRYIPD